MQKHTHAHAYRLIYMQMKIKVFLSMLELLTIGDRQSTTTVYSTCTMQQPLANVEQIQHIHIALHTYFHFKSIGNPAAHLKYCKDAMEQTLFKLRTYFWLMLFIYTIKLRKIHVISNIYNYITTHNLSIKYAHSQSYRNKKFPEKLHLFYIAQSIL